MIQHKLDQVEDGIFQELSQLPRWKIAAFSASCSERFVGLYEDFSEKASWGNFNLLRHSLNLAWDFLSGEQVSEEQLQSAISDIDRLVPHVNDFDLVETTLAQDACICVVQALAWCVGESDSPPSIVEYSFEALLVARTCAFTGCLDLGDSPEAAEFEEILVRDPYITKEIRLQREDLQALRSEEASRDTLITLRKKAVQNQWKAADLLEK